MENNEVTFAVSWIIDRNHARCEGCGLVYETDDPYYFQGCQVCIEDGVFDLEDDEDFDDWEFM